MRRAALAAVLLALAGCGAAPSGGGTASGHDGASRSPAPSADTSAPSTGPFVPRHTHAHVLRWRLPVPVAREAVVATGGAGLLVGGGMVAGDGSTDRVYSLALDTGRRHTLPRLAVPVHDAAGGRYAGRPAVFGGGNATEQSLVQALGPSGWRQVDAFPTTRSDLSVVSVGSTTVALGGYDGTHVPVPVYAQSGASRMRQLGTLRTGVRYAATAVLGRAVYVLGGEVDGHELDVVQRLDTRTGRTRVVGHLPVPLGHAMAAAIGDRILLMGGRTGPDTQTDAMWWFDPATATFSRAGRLPRALSDAAVAVDGHTAYLLGGEDPAVTDRVVRVVAR